MKNVRLTKSDQFTVRQLGNNLTSEKEGELEALSQSGWYVTSIWKITMSSRAAVLTYLKCFEKTLKRAKILERSLKPASLAASITQRNCWKPIRTCKLHKSLHRNVCYQSICLMLQKEKHFSNCKAICTSMTIANQNLNREEYSKRKYTF